MLLAIVPVSDRFLSLVLQVLPRHFVHDEIVQLQLTPHHFVHDERVPLQLLLHLELYKLDLRHLEYISAGKKSSIYLEHYLLLLLIQ
jgi:hypothetical protein